MHAKKPREIIILLYSYQLFSTKFYIVSIYANILKLSFKTSYNNLTMKCRPINCTIFMMELKMLQPQRSLKFSVQYLLRVIVAWLLYFQHTTIKIQFSFYLVTNQFKQLGVSGQGCSYKRIIFVYCHKNIGIRKLWVLFCFDFSLVDQ